MKKEGGQNKRNVDHTPRAALNDIAYVFLFILRVVYCWLGRILTSNYDWTPLCINNVWSKFKTFHILWHYKIWVFLFYLTYFHYFIIFIYIFYMNLFWFIYIIKYIILFCCLNITFSIEMYYICYSIYKIWSFFLFLFWFILYYFMTGFIFY